MKNKRTSNRDENAQTKVAQLDFKKAIQHGSEAASAGLDIAKKNAHTVKVGIAKTAEIVRQKGKDTQMAVLTFVEKKKTARFLEAKLSSFEDGVKEGKIQAVDFIKKYANFCLASTAISYYFARCDGSIDENEMLEIEYDLDSIIKNKDLPISLVSKLAEISQNFSLTFEDVCIYLDGVGIETLKEFSHDIDEIIVADDVITSCEKNAKAEFDAYLRKRIEAENHE